MKRAMKKLMLFAAALLTGLALAAQTAPEEDLDIRYAADLLPAGTEAPDFTLEDIHGNPVALSSFRGRQVVLVFWASWCPDCRAEIPELKAMHAAADPSRVAFVSVSFDRSRETWENFVNENYLPGVQLFDPAGKKDSAVGDAFRVNWIPSLYLIGPDGKVQLATVVAGKVARALQGKSAKELMKRSRGVCEDEHCDE